MPDFVLMLHQTPAKFANLSPEDIQGIVTRYIAWREELVKQGKLVAGEKLAEDGGKHIRLQGHKISVTDGPFTETSEILGGYFVIAASDYEEAVAIAQTCPHVTGAQWIEVRQVEEVH